MPVWLIGVSRLPPIWFVNECFRSPHRRSPPTQTPTNPENILPTIARSVNFVCFSNHYYLQAFCHQYCRRPLVSMFDFFCSYKNQNIGNNLFNHNCCSCKVCTFCLGQNAHFLMIQSAWVELWVQVHNCWLGPCSLNTCIQHCCTTFRPENWVGIECQTGNNGHYHHDCCCCWVMITWFTQTNKQTNKQTSKLFANSIQF